MPQPVLTTLDFGNSRRITGLPSAVSNGQPVIFEQLNAAVEGLAWKDSARVATQANINLASPGATIDGVTMAANDRFLARSQTTGSENGLYIWNGASTPATRSLDANTFDELEQAVVVIEEGSSAGAAFRQTAVNGTLGTTAVNWASFGVSAPAATESTAGVAAIATQAEVDAGTDNTKFVTPAKLSSWSGRFRKATATIGDGSATQYTVTHNFNTRVHNVQVWETSGLYRQVSVEIRATSANAVDIVFDTAPASGAYLVVIEA